MELSVIVPCFNEEFNVDELARRVAGVFEVGGFAASSSSSTTAAPTARAPRSRRCRPRQPIVVGQRHAKNAGIAAAWRTGTAAARGRLVAIIDADLQYQPEDILRMRRELIEHSLDIVQGWRSAVDRTKETRYYLSRGLNTMLNATFGMRLRDNKSGFIVCAKEVMEDLLTYKGSYHYWQSFIMVAAHAKGYAYKEVEILFENRRQGVSSSRRRPTAPSRAASPTFPRRRGSTASRAARATSASSSCAAIPCSTAARRARRRATCTGGRTWRPSSRPTGC